jgi:hypothetical protein
MIRRFIKTSFRKDNKRRLGLVLEENEDIEWLI